GNRANQDRVNEPMGEPEPASVRAPQPHDPVSVGRNVARPPPTPGDRGQEPEEADRGGAAPEPDIMAATELHWPARHVAELAVRGLRDRRLLAAAAAAAARLDGGGGRGEIGHRVSYFPDTCASFRRSLSRIRLTPTIWNTGTSPSGTQARIVS